jgi:hypothetical protein
MKANLLNKRNTYVGSVSKEGYHVYVVASTVNGSPTVHTILAGKEKITGGEILNIFTETKSKEVFSLSALKEIFYELAYIIVGEDYRDLNYNLSSDFTSLDPEFLEVTGDFKEKYTKNRLKSLTYEYVTENINKAFTFKYTATTEIVSNDLPKASFIEIDSSVYKSKEDIENIENNKATVAGAMLPKCARSTLEAFRKGTHNCALFYGEASTGKSFASRIIAAELGIPVYSYNFAAGSDESFVQGKYAPKEDEAGFTFLQNQFIKAYSEGGLFVAEELNYAFANVTGPLNSALDFLKKITLANEKHVPMHPNFRMITCINPGYEGTQPLNRALLSRQEIVVRFENITPEEVAQRLKDRYGYENSEFAIKIGEFIDKLNSTLYSQSIDGYVSLREIESCLKLAQLPGVSLKDAIKESILNKVMLNETSQVYDLILNVVKPDIRELDELYTQSVSQDPELVDLVITNINDDDLSEIFASAKSALESTEEEVSA